MLLSLFIILLLLNGQLLINIRLISKAQIFGIKTINIIRIIFQMTTLESARQKSKSFFTDIVNTSSILTLNPKLFRQSLSTIIKSYEGLSEFSDSLQQRIDSLLKAQETQFVNSYINHMKKVKTQFQSIQNRVKEYQKRLEYYQNEGMIFQLLKTKAKLENETGQLYKKVENLEKNVRNLELDNKIYKDQISRLNRKIKINMQANIRKQVQLEDFTPQIKLKTQQNMTKQRKNSLEEGFNTQLIKTRDRSTYKQRHLALNIDTSNTNPCQSMIGITNKLKTFKGRHKVIIQQRNKYEYQKSEMYEFFVKSVEQIKKNVKLRSKINYCSFQDFKKQDKFTLLTKIVSNDQILRKLYDIIFNFHKYQIPKDTTEFISGQKKLPFLGQKKQAYKI